MTIQDELMAAADDTRHEVEAQVDVGAALEATRTRADSTRRRPNGRVLLAVAASAALIVGVATFALLHDDDVVRTGPTATEPPATLPPSTVTTGLATSAPPSTAIDAPVPTAAPTVAPTNDVVTVPADRRIDFDGAADRRIGQVLAASEVTPFEGGPCGYWPNEPGDVDQLHGLVEAAGTSSPRIADVRIDSPTYRTVSGVGVDTRLSTLQSVYRDLVVDRADGWDHPTGGLLASYSDVAAIRSGDRAITFTLRDDIVTNVKVSAAEYWGDDEGCV